MLFPNLIFGDALTERIRCPVHGFIHYSRRERQIIDHWVFQRLRNVRQLALTYYVYPGAMHSRFEHSLGVMDLATRAFEVLSAKFESLLIEELSPLPGLGIDTLKRGKQALRMLALLHDVGHPAFSHAAEDALPHDEKYAKMIRGGSKKHEQLSLYVINEVLRENLDSLFFDGMCDLLVGVLSKDPQFTFLRQFVVGELDMDRTDYLLRDSLHCGVLYGRFDHLRLLESLAVLKHPHTDQLQIGIERGGEHTFEALILARYQMNTQVYYHKVRRIYDVYLIKFMTSWGAEHYKSFADVLNYADLDLLVEMQKECKNRSTERGDLAFRITHRKHHRKIWETGDNADAWKLRQAKSILGRLRDEFRNTNFEIDDARASIHRVTYRGQQDDSKVEDFYIVDNYAKPRLITEESGILEKIPTDFRNVRIYADSEDPDELHRISSAAATAEKES